MNRQDRIKVWNALLIPLLFVLVLIAIHFFQSEILAVENAVTYREKLPLNKYGMQPRKFIGLRGIFTMPFLHGSWNHLYNNSISLLFLGWAMFYFYKDLVWRTALGIMVLGGFWLWLAGEYGSTHIGASGLLYGLVSFLFFSGVVRQYKQLIAISMLVVFLYGSLIWGVFPIKEDVSWEGHLWGAVAGIVMAFYYKIKGPQRPKYAWELEEDDDEDDEDAPWNQDPNAPPTSTQEDERRVVYHWRGKR